MNATKVNNVAFGLKTITLSTVLTIARSTESYTSIERVSHSSPLNYLPFQIHNGEQILVEIIRFY